MIPGQWAGHMWNEVYVGRWIPVDAGANEVGTSFVLVKLIDHETVEGTQPLRQALPASFGIAIKDHPIKAFIPGRQGEKDTRRNASRFPTGESVTRNGRVTPHPPVIGLALCCAKNDPRVGNGVRRARAPIRLTQISYKSFGIRSSLEFIRVFVLSCFRDFCGNIVIMSHEFEPLAARLISPS
jgi:hypothetical protein